MSPEQIIEAASLYSSLLRERGYEPQEYPLTTREVISSKESLEHSLWLADTIPILINTNQIDKANLWIGFIQGCLWRAGEYYSIDELRERNSPAHKTKVRP